jgi:hypothetical protein
MKDNKIHYKQTPTSLRQLLAQFVDNEGSHKKAAESIRENINPDRRKIGSTRSYSDFLTKVIKHDSQDIKYYHLEGISNYIGVPVGFLLLFSRMRSNQSKKNFEENVKIMEWMKFISSTFDPNKELDINELYAWSEKYNEIKLMKSDQAYIDNLFVDAEEEELK